MTTDIVATFENGVFKPETPVDCPDHARVRLKIEPLGFQARWDENKERRQQALQDFLHGVSQQPIHSGGEHFNRDDLYDRD